MWTLNILFHVCLDNKRWTLDIKCARRCDEEQNFLERFGNYLEDGASCQWKDRFSCKSATSATMNGWQGILRTLRNGLDRLPLKVVPFVPPFMSVFLLTHSWHCRKHLHICAVGGYLKSSHQPPTSSGWRSDASQRNHYDRRKQRSGVAKAKPQENTNRNTEK